MARKIKSEEWVRQSGRRGYTATVKGGGRLYQRCLDNLFVERLWRSIKSKEVYLQAQGNGRETKAGLDAYFRFFNTEQPHQALEYRTPLEGVRIW